MSRCIIFTEYIVPIFLQSRYKTRILEKFIYHNCLNISINLDINRTPRRLSQFF